MGQNEWLVDGMMHNGAHFPPLHAHEEFWCPQQGGGAAPSGETNQKRKRVTTQRSNLNSDAHGQGGKSRREGENRSRGTQAPPGRLELGIPGPLGRLELGIPGPLGRLELVINPIRHKNTTAVADVCLTRPDSCRAFFSSDSL